LCANSYVTYYPYKEHRKPKETCTGNYKWPIKLNIMMKESKHEDGSINGLYTDEYTSLPAGLLVYS
jgi:hypothetical protein